MEALCELLFRKKEYITSGKIQLLGLENIKKRIGKRWPAVCEVVYETAERVLAEELGRSDLSIRYRDDTYVIVFGRADLEEGRQRIRLIAARIQEALFALDEEDLRVLVLRNAVGRIGADSLGAGGYADFLDALEEEDDDGLLPFYDDDEEVGEEEAPPLMAQAVGANDVRRHTADGNERPDMSGVVYGFQAVWDVRRKLISTYLCLANAGDGSGDMTEHVALYEEQRHRTGFDLCVLERVSAELRENVTADRKVLIGCPVAYDTLHDAQSFELYRDCLESLDAEARQYLVLLVWLTSAGLPKKQRYWFASALKMYAREVHGEVSLSDDVNLAQLRARGIDGVGGRLRAGQWPEKKALAVINGFGMRAQSSGKVFLLGCDTLSVTTSAVCAGFGLIGGRAVRDVTKDVAAIERFAHADLLRPVRARVAAAQKSA